MKIGEVAREAAVSVKAIRYYEATGLLAPKRASNGYREFSDRDVRAVAEIKHLSAAGIPLRRIAPFLECLEEGHEHGDDCPASLAEYRSSIAELDEAIARLTARREELARRLDDGARRSFGFVGAPHDPLILPPDLPVPDDDGAADHLVGMRLPDVVLPSTAHVDVPLGEILPGRTILYFYPLTGRPGVDLPEGWDAIPGARGCTPEACGFRDHHEALRAAGAAAVYGVSSQSTAYQAELVRRLRLPFSMLSDEGWILAEALGLPTFVAPGRGRLYRRLTLVVHRGVIEHVFYPVFPPDEHARNVLDWLSEREDSSVIE